MDRILIISWDLNPERGSESGVAHTYLKIYLKHFSVDVYTFEAHKPDILKFNYGNNVSFYYVKYTYLDRLCWKLKAEIISNWIFCKRIYYRILKNDPDQYKFMHIITPAGYFSFNNLFKSKIKYIIGPVNGGLLTPKNFDKIFRKDAFRDFFRTLTYKIITKLPGWFDYYENASAIIISSESLLPRFPKRFHEKSFQIFDTLVDHSIFLPDEKRRNHKDVVVLFSGRLIPLKGIQLLLDSFHICLDEYRLANIKLKIAGDGILMEELKNFVQRNNYSNKVFILGNIKRDSLINEYQSADIFCLPTLRENGGTAILEAMSCGLPVVTSNYGGPAFSVTEECGIKIEMNCFDQYVIDLAKALYFLHQNPDIRVTMGKKARERILSEFSINSVESKLINIWDYLETTLQKN